MLFLCDQVVKKRLYFCIFCIVFLYFSYCIFHVYPNVATCQVKDVSVNVFLNCIFFTFPTY